MDTSTSNRETGIHPPSFVIFIDKKQYRVMQPVETGAQLKGIASIPLESQLFLERPGEKPLPIGDADKVDMRDGLHFFDVAPGTFGAELPLGPILTAEIATLKVHHPVDLYDLGAGDVAVQIHGLPLPPGWNRPTADVLLRVPKAYPTAQLDSFMADAALRLASGQMPTNASAVSCVGRMWIQFSWHLRKWVAGVDNLLTYLGFVRGRLNEVR